MEKLETLEEAFEAAMIEAQGHSENNKVPIFKNEDGTYQIGSIQDIKYNDIPDGTFEEIGSVTGWDVSYFNFGEYNESMTEKEKAKEAFQQNGNEWFTEFCDRYEVKQ